DLTPLLELKPQEIVERMYTKRSELGDLLPIGLKLIHVNKCPVIAPAKTLTKDAADKHGINRALCRKNLDLLLANPQLRETVTQVYQMPNDHPDETNPDLMLYSGGFFSHHDKNAMERLLQTPPEQLPALEFNFEDKRLDEMLFRYRARNYPLTLSASEQQRWNDYRMNTMDGQGYAYQLETLALENDSDERKMNILKALFEYANSL
ncbi:MAG: exodeoxyribonuclease I, partial [Psychrobium sp.]